MKRLTKTEWTQITKAMAACQKRKEALSDSVVQYNVSLDKIRDDLGEQINAYNASVSDLREVYKDLAGNAQDYYDERSESWQASDAGSTYSEWIGQLDDVDGLEEADIELPEAIEELDLPDFTDVSWLPPEAPGE